MRHDHIACGIVAVAFLCATPAVGHADDAALDAKLASQRTFADIIDNFSVRIGLESAGPILFNDTEDQQLERTTVFQYGARLAFLFGDEHRDAHRLGLGLAYNFVADSESRDLKFIDPYLMYEAGHPFVLQLHGGASIATGTKDLADDHGGLYSAAALRYSLDRADRSSMFRVSPGLIAKSYLVTGDMSDSSFFVGAQIEFTYNTNK